MKNVLVVVILFVGLLGYAQDIEEHHHPKNEIGMANSIVHFIGDNKGNYGIHFHYVRKIKKTNFGMGLSYERIFDIHKHSTFGIVFNYTVFEGLNLSISPGLAFEDGSKTPEFATHFEMSYEFEILDEIHIGPLLEFAKDTEDAHISFGLHLGIGF